jgi:thiamine biosynthesis lipoprotein
MSSSAQAAGAAVRRVSAAPARRGFEALGLTGSVTVTDPERLDIAHGAAVDVVRGVEAACSRLRLDSELARLNAAAGRRLVVGDVLFSVIELALRVAALTDGAVDPTRGLALRRGGCERDMRRVATDASRRSPAAPRRLVHPGGRASWRDVRVDAIGRTVTLPTGLRLDVDASAAPIAADRAAAWAARAAPGAGVLIEFGEHAAAAGPAPEPGWSIPVHDGGPTGRLTLGGLATAATVGTWARVSVAACTCAEAHVASTAALGLGREAPRWLRLRRLPARLVAHDGSVLVVGEWSAGD